MHPRVAKMLSRWGKKEDRGRNYLVVGGGGEDREEVAHYFTEHLLCRDVCGQCSHCKLYRKNAHPDVIRLEKSGGSIKIEQIRELHGILHHGPYSAPTKIVIIPDLEALTREAANALLKSLEESPPNIVFLLLAQRQEGIPPTVISRCQRIPLPDAPISPLPPEEAAHFQTLLKASTLERLTAFEKIAEEKEQLPSALQGLTAMARNNVLQDGLSHLPTFRAALTTNQRLHQNVNPALALTVLALEWK